jgi:hypothetical protein
MTTRETARKGALCAAACAVLMLGGCSTSNTLTFSCYPVGADIHNIDGSLVGSCWNNMKMRPVLTDQDEAEGGQRLVFDVRWPSGAVQHVDYFFDLDKGHEQTLTVRRPPDHPNVSTDHQWASLFEMATVDIGYSKVFVGPSSGWSDLEPEPRRTRFLFVPDGQATRVIENPSSADLITQGRYLFP